jgi:hypothetical protein
MAARPRQGSEGRPSRIPVKSRGCAREWRAAVAHAWLMFATVERGAATGGGTTSGCIAGRTADGDAALLTAAATGPRPACVQLATALGVAESRWFDVAEQREGRSWRGATASQWRTGQHRRQGRLCLRLLAPARLCLPGPARASSGNPRSSVSTRARRETGLRQPWPWPAASRRVAPLVRQACERRGEWRPYQRGRSGISVDAAPLFAQALLHSLRESHREAACAAGLHLAHFPVAVAHRAAAGDVRPSLLLRASRTAPNVACRGCDSLIEPSSQRARDLSRQRGQAQRPPSHTHLPPRHRPHQRLPNRRRARAQPARQPASAHLHLHLHPHHDTFPPPPGAPARTHPRTLCATPPVDSRRAPTLRCQHLAPPITHRAPHILQRSAPSSQPPASGLQPHLPRDLLRRRRRRRRTSRPHATTGVA